MNKPHWLIVLLLALESQCFADYLKVPIERCTAPRVVSYRNVKTVDEKYVPRHELKQGKFGTCYSFSSYFLLQYFHNKTNNLQPHDSNLLSINDIIGKAKDKEFCNASSGDPLAPLQAVRNSNYQVCQDS